MDWGRKCTQSKLQRDKRTQKKWLRNKKKLFIMRLFSILAFQRVAFTANTVGKHPKGYLHRTTLNLTPLLMKWHGIPGLLTNARLPAGAQTHTGAPPLQCFNGEWTLTPPLRHTYFSTLSLGIGWKCPWRSVISHNKSRKCHSSVFWKKSATCEWKSKEK